MGLGSCVVSGSVSSSLGPHFLVCKVDDSNDGGSTVQNSELSGNQKVLLLCLL
jgi:hypothetical protein